MVKLHLGCGKRDFGPDWVHIDRADFPHIQHKDVARLPYGDSEVDLIYASHLIAYFDRVEIHQVLKEWRRVLKRRGILRLATPDWNVLRKMKAPMLGPLYGKMSEPPIYHKTVYNLAELRQVLKDAGFKDIHRYDHRRTDHPYNPDRSHKFNDHSGAHLDDGTLISLNVECRV